MSSATPTDVAKSRGIVKNAPNLSKTNTYGEGSGPTDGLNDRQILLDWYWRFYRCLNYAPRNYDWNGHQITSPEETDIIAQSGVIPAGFYDAGKTLPLKFRRPSAPYYLAKVVVARFTALLFSKKRQPQILCDDIDTQDWLRGFADEARLWTRAIKMRNFGGGMGSVAVGFKFVNGKPYVEVHDARWCDPTFEDRETLVVEKFEKRYTYPEQVRDPETGEWVEEWFWYRRVIDATTDTVWPKVKAEHGREPDWPREAFEQVVHDFGECPVVWIQNEEVDDSIDGDPDCHGIFDLIEAIDELLSQGHRGAKHNCDPTVGIASDAEFDEVNKGSGHALQVEKGGRLEYLEMSGSGIERAQKLADDLEKRALVIARTVLDDPDKSAIKTATEIEKRYTAMLERADVFREQYGDRGLKRLLEMVLRAARKLSTTKVVGQDTDLPKIVQTVIELPKLRVQKDKTKPATFVDRKLGSGERVDLKWPDYFTPTLDARLKGVQAAGAAYQTYKIIDERTAVEFIKEYMGIEDVEAVLEALETRRAEAQAEFESKTAGMLNGLTAPKMPPNPSKIVPNPPKPAKALK